MLNLLKTGIIRYGWKTLTGTTLLVLGMSDKVLLDFIPDSISNFAVTLGTGLAGVGMRLAVSKLIAVEKEIIDLLKKKINSRYRQDEKLC